jgi:hypothetical protein
MRKMILNSVLFLLLIASWSVYPPAEVQGQKREITKILKAKADTVLIPRKVAIVIDSFMRKQVYIDSMSEYALTSAKKMYLQK